MGIDLANLVLLFGLLFCIGVTFRQQLLNSSVKGVNLFFELAVDVKFEVGIFLLFGFCSLGLVT